MIYGFVHNRITHENLYGTKVSLMKNDSVIATWITGPQSDVNGKSGPFFFQTDLKNGNYVLLFEKEGYNIVSWPLVNPKPVKNGETRFIADVPLDKTPKERTLNGVTITATKVKFYNRGDTLIYDADAFQTAEGSMLDALIKQLPGVELDDNGQIFVNGKKVESLLLNGEKFFDGNNQIMLENLPAYMVKDVKTYERLGIESQLVGKDVGDSQLVMDIGLKKKYQIGWIANFEAGRGNEERYLARLFAMRFTPNSRISLYGNFNNLNDTRKPGEQSSWTPETMPSGLMATKKGGADFFVKNKRESVKYNANIELQGTNLDRRTELSQELYLPEGNVYNRYKQLTCSKNFMLFTKHELELKSSEKGFAINIYPTLKYNKYDRKYNNDYFAFNSNPNIKGFETLVDSINIGTNDNALRSAMINRSASNIKNEGRTLNATFFMSYYQKIGSLSYLTLGTDLNYKNQHDRQWKGQIIENPKSLPGVKQVYNRYTSNRPNNDLSSRTIIGLRRTLNNNLALQFMYEANYQRTEVDHLTYLSEKLSNENSYDEILPSEIDFMSHFDSQNTSYKTFQTFKQSPKIKLSYDKQAVEQDEKKLLSKINRIKYNIDLPVVFVHDRLDYKRYTYDGVTKRNNVWFEPSTTLNIQANNYQDYFWLSYKLTRKAPGMEYSINILNNENPLSLFYGNENLKNTTIHNAELLWQHTNKKKQRQRRFEIEYTISHNSVSYGYTYDKTTGIRTFRPYNVTGNYTLSATYSFTRPLDKKHRLTLENKFNERLTHGVDMISTDINIEPQRSSVLTSWTTDRIKLNYRLNKNLSLGTKGYIGYGHSTSSRNDFSAVTLCDFHYGATVLLSLPYKWQVSTDIMMYSRRGYSNSSANTNDLVWNARLSKTFTKTGITVAIDGFDILNNLSNISQVINSQGRTETYYNSLPRYVMAHIIYRFNKKPKKD